MCDGGESLGQPANPTTSQHMTLLGTSLLDLCERILFINSSD